MHRAVDVVPGGGLLVPVEAVVPHVLLLALQRVHHVVAAVEEEDAVERFGAGGKAGGRRADRQVRGRDPLLDGGLRRGVRVVREVVGEQLRAMMPWIAKNRMVDQSKN